MTEVETLKDFFSTSLAFLREYQWIYNYPNTHILVYKILDNIPNEWHHYLNNISNDELNNLPFDEHSEFLPESLKSFCRKIKDLKYGVNNYNIPPINSKLPAHIHVSPKKAHEILHFTEVIHDICSKFNINCIVDVGAGLGYLSQLLYEKFKYNILAIEGNETFFNSAVSGQEKNYPNTQPYIKYVNHFVTQDSSEYIEKSLLHHFTGSYKNGVCIVGLHACADLSVTLLEIFRQLDFVKYIIIMPCCYHRLDVTSSDNNEERFIHFPVSSTLQTIYESAKGWEFLRRFFMRLACQQTKGVWKKMTEQQHVEHSISCMFRAAIQEVAEEGNLTVKRRKRKTGKPSTKLPSEDYVQYLVDNIPQTHDLPPKEGNSIDSIDYTSFQSRVLECWNANKSKCKLLEGLTAFQTSIQHLCEMIVLLDRVCFLREKGLNCTLYKVTDDNISPRCHALVATKL